jgi:nicotinate-nucleotide adenylyltransferase
MSSLPATDGGAIGLLGGTFDPIHNGHLRVAIEAQETLKLDHVRLLPLNVPGHRAPAQASVEDRCAMLRASVAPPLIVDDTEIERGGVSYTVDTLEHLRSKFARRPLCLIVGLDAYLTLPSWHRPQDILRLAHIIVAARPDVATTSSDALDELIGNAQSADVTEFIDQLAGRVFFLDLPLLPIASSDLRRRCLAGLNIRHLVPDQTADYISEHQLYQT